MSQSDRPRADEKILALIPAYNEEATIEAVIKGVRWHIGPVLVGHKRRTTE